MTEKRLLSGASPGLAPDQRAVFDAYFDGSGVVCTPAGSGTGKTTTAIEVVAEAVVRELDRGEGNPFESILVTTFTKDAARNLETELKNRLREHRDAAGPDDPVVRQWDDLLRWLETASHVRTIDSFTQELLREVALEVGVAPSFGVADGIRRSDLLEDVFADLRSDPDLTDAVSRLDGIFPPDEDGHDWEAMVVELHRRCREFCVPVEEARRDLLSAVTEMHAGHRPESFADLLAIVDSLTDYGADHASRTIQNREAWVEHARRTYEASHRLAGDFGVVLDRFADRYDRRSRSRGVLSHTDITYLVREFLEGGGDAGTDPAREGDATRSDPRERFRTGLERRFRHVVVDEFQDTNFAQCRILAHLLGAEVRGLLIGDLKQSIYEWRAAEPRLFSEVIDHAHGRADGNVLGVADLRPEPLAENFRSHPHLVSAANHVFPRLFDDPARGGIGTFDVEYDALTPRRVETQPDEPHVHALRIDEPEDHDADSRREALVEREAERVAGTLRAAFDRGALAVDRNRAVDPADPDSSGDQQTSADPDLDRVQPGDVAILFRTKTYMRRYSEMLDQYGIENAVIGSASLFREPEVGAVIDVLAWVGRPRDPDAVERLVRSPVAGLSGAGIDRVERAGFDLKRALEGWPADGAIGEGADGAADDRRRVRELVALRADLRADRDASKAQLVCDLLAHSGFDLAALADGNGLQRYANLRQFVAVVDGWEDDDRLSYREFVRRLDRLRSGAVDDDTTLADVADMDSPDTVKLLTVHAAKGLEFPVVVLADTAQNEAYHKACDRPFVADRRHGLALRPTTGGSDPPDDGQLPTFDGGWFHEDDSEYDFDRGLLWLSEIRGTDGRIRHDHPLREYVEDARAEYWRLLYVAFTRAGDHLIAPLSPVGSDGEWTTWSAALGAYLDPGDGDALETEGPGPDRVPIGVDEIDPAEPPGSSPIGVAELFDPDRDPADADPGTGTVDPAAGTGSVDPAAGTGGANPATGIAGRDAEARDRRFVPASLSATGIEGLLEGPDRFQRTVLRGIDDPGDGAAAREAETPAGATPPAGLPAATWGDAVHALLEVLHRRPDPAALVGSDADDDAVASAVRRAISRAVDDTETLRAAVDSEGVDPDRIGDGPVGRTLRESVLPAYAATDTWTAVRDADPVVPELPVAAPLPVDAVADDRPVLEGQVDLLYRSDGWQIADFKTGTPAESGTRQYDSYRTQLDAYAWLLRAVYGIEPASARLVYLHPDPAEVPVDVDPDRFRRRVVDAVDALEVRDSRLVIRGG